MAKIYSDEEEARLQELALYEQIHNETIEQINNEIVEFSKYYFLDTELKKRFDLNTNQARVISNLIFKIKTFWEVDKKYLDISIKRMSVELFMSEQTLRRILRQLEEKNLIKEIKAEKGYKRVCMVSETMENYICERSVPEQVEKIVKKQKQFNQCQHLIKIFQLILNNYREEIKSLQKSFSAEEGFCLEHLDFLDDENLYE